MLNTRMFVICTSGCLPSRHPDVKGGFTRVFKSFCRYFYEKKSLVVTYLSAKLLQKSEMRKDIVIELSYKGFG